jgi:sortase A
MKVTFRLGRWIETAFWLLGIALLGTYLGARAYGENERRHAIVAFADARGEIEQARYPITQFADVRIADIRVPDQAHWSEGRIRAYAADATEPARSETLPAALLRVRRLGLEVPVYADTGERTLNRGAGLVEGTALPDSDGNIAIAAHRDGYFRVLKDVAVGDVIELESLSRLRSYRITELAIVAPTDIWPLHATDEPTVTLITCYPFYFVGNAPQRFIVRAVAEDKRRKF